MKASWRSEKNEETDVESLLNYQIRNMKESLVANVSALFIKVKIVSILSIKSNRHTVVLLYK